MALVGIIVGMIFGIIVAALIVFICFKLGNRKYKKSNAVLKHRPGQLESSYRSPIVLNRLRGQERRNWAQDDMECARQEKGGFLVQESEIDLEPAISSHQPANQQSGLLLLPLELRIQIYSQLDYGTALRLGGTSHAIHNDHPHSYINREQRATYIFHAETFPNNIKAERLACYRCLRVRPSRCFRDDRWIDEFVRFGSRELERLCFECRLQSGEVTRTAASMWSVRRALRMGGDE